MVINRMDANQLLKGDQSGLSSVDPLLPGRQPVWLRCHPHRHPLRQRGRPRPDSTWVMIEQIKNHDSRFEKDT